MTQLKHKIICGDFLEVGKTIKDDLIDLIILDAPYNIGKDKTWDCIPNYVEWMGKVFLECQRVLKDNGSFYFFHNDFLQLVKLQQWISDNTEFVFKQLLIWDKWHTPFKVGNDLQGAFYKIVNNPDLRNYPKMAEYVLFYTFQGETGLTTVMLDTNNFTTLRKYFKDLQEHIGISKKGIIDRIGQQADHCFRWKSSQWDLPTRETYQKLINHFSIDKWKNFRGYKNLREEYENLRYTFNQTTNDTSVLCYPIANTKERVNHVTQKPIALIENIIKHSSNKADIILDPMCGSGTTLIAANRLGCNSIGIEISKEYCEIAHKRLLNEVQQTKFNGEFNKEQSTIETVGF